MKLTAPFLQLRGLRIRVPYHLTPASTQTHGQSARGTGVSPQYGGFTLIIFPPMVHYTYLHYALVRGASGSNLGTLKL